MAHHSKRFSEHDDSQWQLHHHDPPKRSPSSEDLHRFPPDLLLPALKQIANGTADKTAIELIHQAISKGIIEISISDKFQGVAIKAHELESAKDVHYSLADEFPCHYVKDATNQMYDLLNDENSEENMLEVARIGYITVNRLISDPDFHENVAKAETLREENRLDCLTIVEEVQHFAEFFLSTEWAVLVLAGVNRKLADDLTNQAKQLRLATVSILEKGDGNIMGGLRRLRMHLDQLGEMLKRSKREELNQERIKRTLLKITYALGGASVVVLNVTVGTMMLSSAGSAVSEAVGSALIQEAVKIG